MESGARHDRVSRAPLSARASHWLRALWTFAAHRHYLPLYVSYFCFWGGARALASASAVVAHRATCNTFPVLSIRSWPASALLLSACLSRWPRHNSRYVT